MLNSKKGQSIVSLLSLGMGIIIYILASPILYDIIVENVGQMGTATALVVKFFLWFILIVLIAFLIKILNSGEGFFVS